MGLLMHLILSPPSCMLSPAFLVVLLSWVFFSVILLWRNPTCVQFHHYRRLACFRRSLDIHFYRRLFSLSLRVFLVNQIRTSISFSLHWFSRSWFTASHYAKHLPFVFTAVSFCLALDTLLDLYLKARKITEPSVWVRGPLIRLHLFRYTCIYLFISSL